MSLGVELALWFQFVQTTMVKLQNLSSSKVQGRLTKFRKSLAAAFPNTDCKTLDCTLN